MSKVSVKVLVKEQISVQIMYKIGFIPLIGIGIGLIYILKPIVFVSKDENLLLHFVFLCSDIMAATPPS